MQIEVLTLFQKELKEGIALIEKFLPAGLKDIKIRSDLARIFHSLKGAASLLKIDSIRVASQFLEKRIQENPSQDDELLYQGINAYLALLKELAEEKETFFEKIQEKEKDFFDLEKNYSAYREKPQEKPIKEKPESNSFLGQLKEVMTRFKQHLDYCETQFDDLERLLIIEELSLEIKEIGIENHIPLLQQAGKALNLCFFAARKKLLGWTRGHFDLITEIVEFLTTLSSQNEKHIEAWIEKHQKNVFTCIGIILAIANEAIQFVQQDIEVDPISSLTNKKIAEPSITLQFDEKDLRFLNLFLIELKDQMKDFENDLLLLEKVPGDKDIASKLMRLSHSLKGAAKVVDLHQLMRLAHCMEDLFSFVQKEEGPLSIDAIDALFKAVDLLNSLTKVDSPHLTHWLSSHKKEIEEVVNDLCRASDSCGDRVSEIPSNIKEGLSLQKTLKKKQSEKAEEEAKETIPLPEDPLPSHDQRFLRISLPHINHLMEVAGEFLVEAKSHEIFQRDINQLKIKASDLERIVGKLKATPFLSSMNLTHVLSLIKEHIADIHSLNQGFDRYSRTFETLSMKFYHEMVESRMRPFREGTEFLPRLIRDLCKQLGKKAVLEIQGKETLVDREILEKLEVPLTHLVRNAVDHGIESPLERIKKGKNETGTIKVEAIHRSGSLIISVSDDGQGIDLESIRKMAHEKNLSHETVIKKMNEEELLRFLFYPGFSTSKEITEISGRGIGLNVVISVVEQLGGRVAISIEKGSSFTMVLPLTLSIIRALIVKIAGEPYAFPLAKIKKVLYLTKEEVVWIEGREYFREGGTNIGLVSSDQVFGIPFNKEVHERISVVIISDGINDYGVSVDSFIGEREIAIHELDKKLGKIEIISAASIMEDGSPLLIVDVEGLKKSIDNSISKKSISYSREEGNPKSLKPKKILIADDSPIVRKVLSYLLSNKGFTCFQAGDGEEGVKLLHQEKFDLIITDIDMPKVSGLELIHILREELRDQTTPIVILSYKDENSMKFFMEKHLVGHFFSKNHFQDSLFLNLIEEITTPSSAKENHENSYR